MRSKLAVRWCEAHFYYVQILVVETLDVAVIGSRPYSSVDFYVA